VLSVTSIMVFIALAIFARGESTPDRLSARARLCPDCRFDPVLTLPVGCMLLYASRLLLELAIILLLGGFSRLLTEEAGSGAFTLI
jgi:hypothetical protein